MIFFLRVFAIYRSKAKGGGGRRSLQAIALTEEVRYRAIPDLMC